MEKTFIFLGLILFVLHKIVQCHEGSIKTYLSSYKNIHVSNFTPALSNISFFHHVKYISFEAYGKEFKIGLELYLPLHNRYECQKNLNENDDFTHVLGNELALYQGKVKNVSDSLVLGFFMDSGNFKGYVVMDKVYCIEYDNESGIIYRFQDVTLPGCKKSKNGKKMDCPIAKFFDILSYEELESKKTHSENVREDSTEDALDSATMANVINIETPKSFNKAKDWMYPKGESNTIKTEQFDEFFDDLFKNTEKETIKSLKDHAKDMAKENLKKPEIMLDEEKHKSPWQIVLDKEMELLKVLEDLDAELFNKKHLSQKNISTYGIHYMSCSIEVIVSSPTVLNQHGHSNDLIRDIYLQTEMLNLLFKKLSFKNKTKKCQINFHIEKIISHKKAFYSSNSSDSFKSFVGKHALKNHSCLVLGLDVTSSSNYIISHIKTKHSNAICSHSIDPVVIKYGTTEERMPMALFLVAYATAITKAFGATHKGGKCHHLSSTSVGDIEKYFLTKNVLLESLEGPFSQCNVEEIERCLPKKRSLRQLSHSKCGNAITEEGEQCDCGPELLCNDIDKCCIPPTNRSDVQSCALRPHAECSSKSPCCKNCKFSKKGTKCTTGNDDCPVGECDGNRSVCNCNMIASWSRSPCQGLECGAIICARVGLKACICEGKDACLICCEKKKTCLTATFDLKVAGNTLFFFPDGSECNLNNICYNGTCVSKGERYPFDWKTGKLAGISLHHLNRSTSGSSRYHSSLVVACLILTYRYIISFILL